MRPSSRPITSADLPLASQLATAWRLKLSSNLRCVRTGIGLFGLIMRLFACFPVRQFEATSPARLRRKRRNEERQNMSKAHEQGKSDAKANKGQKEPNSFTNDKERKDYQAGWNEGKKKGN